MCQSPDPYQVFEQRLEKVIRSLLEGEKIKVRPSRLAKMKGMQKVKAARQSMKIFKPNKNE